MLKLLIVFSLNRPMDLWIAKDKIKHFGVSAVISSYLYVNTKSVVKAGGLTLGIGILKEIYDMNFKKAGFFSFKDLLYDFAGTVYGIGMYYKKE